MATARGKLLWAVVLLLPGLAWARTPVPAPGIVIHHENGSVARLTSEDTNGLFGRPVTKTTEKLHRRYHREFVYFYQVHLADGEKVSGSYPVTEPLRITLYEIRKNDDTERTLRVIGSKYYEAGETAEWSTELDKHDEHVFIVTAERTGDPERLNQHLKYMNEQENNEILVKGFSTNWNFSALKFKMAERDGSKENKFVKDGEWLVDKLISPKWVCSVRVR